MRCVVAALAIFLTGLSAVPILDAQVRPVPQLPGGQVTGDLGSGEAPQPVGTTFRTATELVALNVSVIDARNRFVTGLTKDDFAVFEDGVRQDLSFFGSSNVPLDVAVMIDTSASMTDKIELVHQAATKFIEALREGDRAEVIGFSSEAQVLVPFTGDHGKLESAINATTPHGSTSLYNSVYVAIEDLSRLAKRENGVRRPAIVVLTDGDDTSSLLTFDDLLDAAKRSNVAVYAISIVSRTDTKRFTDGGSQRFNTESDFALRSLAHETGGRSFFPLELRDLNGVYASIAEELSSQYSLGYAPKGHADGSFHRVFVRVLHPEGVTPRTRTGYYAAKTVRAAIEK